MPDRRGVAVVLLILLIGATAGALAGYRMYVQQRWIETGGPIDANVTIDWPDGTRWETNVTLVAREQTALGALEAAAERGGFPVQTSFFEDFGGRYVYSIDGHAADGTCGWFFGVGGTAARHRATTAADTVWIEDGALVAWYWGCL